MSLIDQRNRFVLALVQAMIGAISANFRRVAIGPRGAGVELQFALAQE